MSDQKVIIATYDNVFEADLAKGLLEENGIEVTLNNELMNTILTSFAGSMYQLELIVPLEQAETAKDILETYTDGFYTHNILKEEGALLEGHFLLTSGRHSARYTEKIKIIQNPEKVSELCKLMAERLADYEYDAVVGPAFGGIVLAFEVARQMGKQFLFTQHKDEALIIRGGFNLSKLHKVVIIEDIVTTGGSVTEVVDCLKTAKLEVVAIGAIVDRSGGKIDFGSPFLPLLTLDVPSWDAGNCELCKNGKPLTQPGRSEKK